MDPVNGTSAELNPLLSFALYLFLSLARMKVLDTQKLIWPVSHLGQLVQLKDLMSQQNALKSKKTGGER